MSFFSSLLPSLSSLSLSSTFFLVFLLVFLHNRLATEVLSPYPCSTTAHPPSSLSSAVCRGLLLGTALEPRSSLFKSRSTFHRLSWPSTRSTNVFTGLSVLHRRPRRRRYASTRRRVSTTRQKTDLTRQRVIFTLRSVVFSRLPVFPAATLHRRSCCVLELLFCFTVCCFFVFCFIFLFFLCYFVGYLDFSLLVCLWCYFELETFSTGDWFSSASDLLRLLSVPSFHRHPSGCLVRLLGVREGFTGLSRFVTHSVPFGFAS